MTEILRVLTEIHLELTEIHLVLTEIQCMLTEVWCPGNQLEARVTRQCSGRAEADCLARECREAGDWFRWEED